METILLESGVMNEVRPERVSRRATEGDYQFIIYAVHEAQTFSLSVIVGTFW